MIRRMAAVAVVLAAAGCATEVRRTPVAPRDDSAERSPTFMTHVQVEAMPLGQVPNSGAQLPVVSPDGRWIALLELEGDPLAADAPLTGEGVSRLSLSIQPVDEGASRRLICQAGAVWPAFSADSRHLAWIIYENNRCDIAVYDVQTRGIRRISPGLKGMIMAALSPGGDRAAVISRGPAPDQPRLCVVDVATGRVEKCPIDGAAQHYLPQWTADGRIVYLLREADRTYVAQWGPGTFDPEKLVAIPFGGAETDALIAVAGVGRTLSPDGRRFAYFDATSAALTLVDLQTGDSQRLPESFVAGCWFDNRHFVAAGAERMSLFTDPAKLPSLLMRGSWVPLVATEGVLVALTRGDHRRRFALVRLKVTPGE